MNVLVTGGAGYVGGFTLRHLLEKGFHPVVLDNLSTGHRTCVPKEVPFYQGEMGDRTFLEKVFQKHSFDAVFHFSAKALVGESVSDPGDYYANNVAATLNLLDVMEKTKVQQLVFSSSAAVYGTPDSTPIEEDHPKSPINPYGRTKWMVEQILSDYSTAYGLRSVSLRYFNAAGAMPDGSLGEDHDPETHAIPNMLKAFSSGNPFIVFGSDYQTPDGTCVRDYVHVCDLADAHVRALDYLKNGGNTDVFNLGSEEGSSMLELIQTGSRVTGKTISHELGARRPGDPAILVASSNKAKKVLGWSRRFGKLEDILASAWKWHTSHPKGFE